MRLRSWWAWFSCVCWITEGFLTTTIVVEFDPARIFHSTPLVPQSLSYQGTRDLSTKLLATSSRRTNHGVNGPRFYLDLIKSQLGSGDEPEISTHDWQKLKMYLYRVDRRDLTSKHINEVILFLLSKLPKDSVRMIIQQSPRVLTKSVRTQLMPAVSFLESLYGSKGLEEALERNPDLLLTRGLGYQADSLDLIEVYLRNELRMTERNIDTLKQKAPFVFQLAMHKVLSVVAYLTDLLQAEGTPKRPVDETICKLIATHPTLLQLSVPNNLQPRIDFLIQECGLERNDVAMLVKSSSGAVLGLSIEQNLRPTLALFREIVGKGDLRRGILSHPQLLGLSTENLRAKISFFQSIPHHGAPVTKLAARTIAKAPAAFSLSLKDNIEPTVKFLGGVWGFSFPSLQDGNATIDARRTSLNMSSVEPSLSIGSLLSENPSLLTMSLEGNIRPTVTFFNRTGYVTLNDEWHLQPGPNGKVTILRGRYIAASLFNRLLPRWHYSTQVQEDASTTSAKVPPLHLLASATDETFCERMSFDLDEYKRFKAEATPRLKFSSQFDTWLRTGRPIDL